MSLFGVLYNPSLPLPILLDTIAHSETGHLSGDARALATSPKGARGMYQFLPKNLHDMGYGMPRNIPLSDVLDPTKARELAGQYVTGYSSNKQFTTPLQKLVAYNAGPDFAADWVSRGENIDELPQETKDYIRRAAEYLTETRNNDMAMMSMDVDTNPNITIDGQVIDPRVATNQRIMQALEASRLPRQAPSSYMAPYYSTQQPQPMMSMDVDTNPNINIDGSQVDDTSLVAQAGRAAGLPSAPAAAVVAPSSYMAPQMQNGGGMSLIGKAQAATNTPAASSQQFTKMLSQLGQMQRASAVSGRRRDQSAMAYQPQVGLNDLLIRMGSAGLRGSQTSGLEAMANIGDAYSEAQDLNAKGLAAYQKAMSKGGSGANNFGAIVVNDAISRALPLIGNGWSTGFASFLSSIPGTEAQALKNNLATIKANIGFDKLQAMRDASPTGGALGQVSERELGFLQSVFGSLDQSQSAEELSYNIQLLQYVYNSIIHGEGNHQYPMPVYGGGAGGSSSSSLDAADAIVGIN